MAESIGKIQFRLMRDYYKFFSKYSKGKEPDKKVAWVTAFTPVEILEALDMYYYYPESYAAVVAASEREQDMLKESESVGLCLDCCNYSCCIEGCTRLDDGPRGALPKPDILIATNNQCNTLPTWWNMLAKRMGVELIVIDYPGEACDSERAFAYVTNQHKKLIDKLEKLTGNTLDMNKLDEFIGNSINSVNAWNKIIKMLPVKDMNATALFDDINSLITARCKPDTAALYELMYEDVINNADADTSKMPVFWLGYPLWYHPDRYLKEYMDDFRIAGANYVTWWSIDYSGANSFEKLFNAYNYTFLNLNQESRNKRLLALIEESGAKGCVSLHNKSCKCDFVSARDIKLPQAELEMDMIDRNYLDTGIAKERLELLKETICTLSE